jgi:hypothetical protein
MVEFVGKIGLEIDKEAKQIYRCLIAQNALGTLVPNRSDYALL